MALRVRLLGGLDIEGVEFSRLGSRKARTLLGCLALGRGRPVAADRLAEIVWPGEDRPKRPADQLSVLVSRLRAVLGTEVLPKLGRGYAFRADWLDVDAMAALVAEARKRMEAGGLAPGRSAIDAAIALDRGPLLPDEDAGDWLDAERETAARCGVLARLTSAQIALAANDPWTATDAAAMALERDAYDEVALRLLMSACAASGRPAQGISAYLAMAARLRDELGLDPAPESTASYVDLLQSGPARPVRISRPVEHDLPGRANEISALDDALDEARAGRLVLAGVAGEAGIGKTRLLGHWSLRLKEVTLLRASGSELAGDLTLQPLLDAIAAWWRTHPHQEADLWQGAARLLGPLLGMPHAADTATDRIMTVLAEPQTGLSMLYAAVDAVLARLAESGPVVLLIDDGHWLDRASVGWIQHAGRRLAGLPVLIVVAYRPGEGVTWTAPREVRLGPLDLATVTEIAGPGRAAALYERSGGHPLFLAELMHAGDRDLPLSIRDAVAERCDRAGPAAATLRAAAVLGPEVDLDLLAAVLGTAPSALLDHLEEGVRRHLLAEYGDGFRFRHQLIREAICAATGSARTALLHRQAARSLRARVSRIDPLDIAHHARLGGDLALAAHALAEAGERAAARFDHEDALRLFDDALMCADEPGLRLRRARVALPAGRFDEASTDAGVALAGGAGAEAMEVAAIAAYLLRDFSRCRRLSEDGARLADDAALRTSCLALAGRVSHVDGDLDAADRFLREARDIAPIHMRALAFLWTAPLRTDRGEPAEALEFLDESFAALVARHPFVVPHRHLAAAQALGMLGRDVAGLAELDLVDATAGQQHTGRFTARADNCRAWILRNTGALAEADARNEAAYAQSLGMLGMTEPVADALLGLADGRLRAAEPAAARTLLQRARQEAAAAHPFGWRHALRQNLLAGRCSLAEGDRAAALTAAADIIGEAERLAVPRYVALGMALAAHVNREPLPMAALARYAPLEMGWLSTLSDHDQ